MELLKYLWASLATILLSSLIAIYRSEILTFFHFNSGKIPLSALSYLLFGIGAFEIGKKWDSFFKPVTKFKRFLNKAIKYGEKLYESKIPDELTRRIYSEKHPGGYMDESQILEFKKLYAEWHVCIHRCFKSALRDEILMNPIITIFATDMASFAFPQYFIYGGMRKGLLESIEQLKKMKSVKSDWLKEFDPSIFKEYEKFRL